jgi:hypothetical protein
MVKNYADDLLFRLQVFFVGDVYKNPTLTIFGAMEICLKARQFRMMDLTSIATTLDKKGRK